MGECASLKRTRCVASHISAHFQVWHTFFFDWAYFFLLLMLKLIVSTCIYQPVSTVFECNDNGLL